MKKTFAINDAPSDKLYRAPTDAPLLGLQNALLCDFAMYARTLLEEKRTDSTEGPDVELARGGRVLFATHVLQSMRRSTDEAVGKIPIRSL